MKIPQEQLNEWASDLDGEISTVEKQIFALQKRRAELQAKRNALRYLIEVAPDSPPNTQEASLSMASASDHMSGGHSLNLEDHAQQATYRLPILEVLDEFGGKGHVQEILPKVKLAMEARGLLRQRDYGDVPSGGEEYWRNLARWERKVMVDLGLLRSGSPRGIWEITEEGRNLLTIQRTNKKWGRA